LLILINIWSKHPFVWVYLGKYQAMRSIVFCLLLFSGMSLKGQGIITSVNNGNFSSPTTWSCSCIPSCNDTLFIIYADVILDIDFDLCGGSITLDTSGSLVGNSPLRTLTISSGQLINDGYVSVSNIHQDNGIFKNSKTVIANNFKSGSTANTLNHLNMTINDTLTIGSGAIFTNVGDFSYAYLDVNLVINLGTLDQKAYLSGNNLYNYGTLNWLGSFGGALWAPLGSIYNKGLTNLTGAINCDKVINTGVFETIAWSNIYCDSLINDGMFTHEGDINTDYFLNGDTSTAAVVFTNNNHVTLFGGSISNTKHLTGDGFFCMGSAINSGLVDGTLDFCNVLGGGFDVNTGTIGSSVTTCINATPCFWAVSVSKEQNENVITVYPNPFTNLINFEMNENSNYALTILNSIGEIVFTNSFVSDRYSIDASNLVPGMYFYRIAGNNKVVSGTLVKE
jgi:Secretion system C-terminal sorting domain